MRRFWHSLRFYWTVYWELRQKVHDRKLALRAADPLLCAALQKLIRQHSTDRALHPQAIVATLAHLGLEQIDRLAWKPTSVQQAQRCLHEAIGYLHKPRSHRPSPPRS